MWSHKLVKNKIHAVLFILLGALSVPIEWDATFFLFTLIIGGYLFFSKENWIYEGEEDDGTSREKTCSKVKAKREKPLHTISQRHNSMSWFGKKSETNLSE